MGIVYPAGIDSFSVPANPQTTSLSSGGSSARDHPESHEDMGNAIVALEANATPLAHDHSGTDGNGIWPTSQLAQANTHQSADTDVTATSLHHTIGISPTQAAAGNHAHDYNGPSIFNQPFKICTSTTRPIDPVLGMVIFEADTNCARAWSQFPGNTLGDAINYTYNFDSNNSTTSLDPAIFTQTVIQGASPADGSMGAPLVGDCAWHAGANVTCQIVSQAVVADNSTFFNDDQIISFTTGTIVIQNGQGNLPDPSNDAYLRMSEDGQTYVRYSVQGGTTLIYCTTEGLEGEQELGRVKTSTAVKKTTWTAKAIGSTYILYKNDRQVLAVTDNDNLVAIGPDYRGWAIGMTGAQGNTAQRVPNNVTTVTVQDATYHSESLIWQLLNWGTVPHIRVEARFRQTVISGPKGNVIGFDTTIQDWIVDPFTNLDVDASAFIITEPGHYQIHISLPWDPGFSGFDQSGVGISVNGQDIGRKSSSFMRGNGFTPAAPQTNETYFTYYFALGDVVRIHARHNANIDQWVYYNAVPPNVFVSWAEFDFQGP